MPRTVLDAGPLIHLDQLDCLDLLEGFEELSAPSLVWREVIRHRPALKLEQIPGLNLAESPQLPSGSLAVFIRTLDLHAGEIAALTLVEASPDGLFLCDDAAARLAAEAMGCTVHGTIGLIVRAVRRRTRTVEEVREILSSIPARSTLHIRLDLLERVIGSLPPT